MKPVRCIARLDIKGEHLIKGIHLEGIRQLGDPREFALRYYREGIDELIYMDAVASLYGRNSLADIVEYTCRNVFVPVIVGGGVRSLADVEKLLRAGADRLAINTAAVARPELIDEVAKRFGAQCMVISIEAKSSEHGDWEVYTDNGRQRTGRDVVAWAREAVDRGAGEILLTSVDREGTREGFDIALMKAVTSQVRVPVTASGGMGKPEHLIEVVQKGGVDAAAMAGILHYKRSSIAEIRQAVLAAGIPVRSMA